MGKQLSKAEREKIDKELDTFFDAHGIVRSAPVDVFKLATELGFDVRGAVFRDSTEGLIIVNENIDQLPEFKSNKVIAYNHSLDLSGKMFIVAHELGHYIDEKSKNMDEKVIVAARDHESNKGQEEQRIDYFAASILVPEKDLLKRFPKPEQVDDKYIRNIAETYIVAFDLAKRRVEEVFG